LEFETLTMAPIDLNLVDVDMLTKQEKQWLNNYHEEVFYKLAKYLDKSEKAWLKLQCRKI